MRECVRCGATFQRQGAGKKCDQCLPYCAIPWCDRGAARVKRSKTYFTSYCSGHRKHIEKGHDPLPLKGQPCLTNGCSRPIGCTGNRPAPQWRGYCTLCYLTGFNVKVGDCWEFLGFRHDGYGSLYYKGRNRAYAHRVMWEESFGPIPNGDQVHHKCANRICINPSHLQLISQRENVAEMHQRNAYIRRIAYLEGLLEKNNIAYA